MRHDAFLWYRTPLALALLLVSLNLQAEEKRQTVSIAEARIKTVAVDGSGGALPGMRKGTASETRDLKDAYQSFKKRTRGDDFSALEKYVQTETNSPWRVSMLHDLGEQYYASGYFSKALAAWEEAWQAGKDLQEPGVKEIVDDVFGNLQKIHSRLGNFERLEALQNELGGRILSGSAKTKALNGIESLNLMKKHPDQAFRCGPLALGRLLALKKGSKLPVDPGVKDFMSTQQGTSLAQVFAESQKLGGGYQMAFREPGAEMVVPAVVHWKAGHFAAVTGRHGKGQYVVKDTTFIDDFVLSENALKEEASGYFLVEAGSLPKGWRTVDTDEAARVWGKGMPDCVNDKKKCPKKECGCKGMAVYSISNLTIGLNIEDIPVWYESGYGPKMDFKVSYYQRDAYQPTTLPYANFGPLWSHNYVAFATYNAGTQHWPLTVQVYDRNGEVTDYTFPTYSGTGTPDFEEATSNINFEDGSILKYYPANSTGSSTVATFERIFADGAKEIYEATDGSTGAEARTYLSAKLSREGPGMTFTWREDSGDLYLDEITDAAGRTTTLDYENSSYPTRITKVTIPDGRYATFEYHPDGTLKKIVDMGGIASEFAYTRGEITELTTPYGTTKFEFATTYVSGVNEVDRWIEITDPAGAKERFQFLADSSISFDDPAGTYPSDADLLTNELNISNRNTFYWNKKTMKNGGGGDYSQAEIFHWVHSYNGSGYTAEPYLESHKKPLENRTFYTYVGQIAASLPGTNPWPTAIARMVKDDQGDWVTQIVKLEYDGVGNIVKTIDPVGRTTIHQYDSNNNRVATLIQSGTSTQMIWSATYAGPGMPQAITDAAGETTTMTWHSTFKKPLTVTNPKGEMGIYTYGTGTNNNGRVTEISGELIDAPISMTYDAKGRLDTTTDGSGYSLSFEYDNLDRPTKVTYPDSTTAETIYFRLDKQWEKDRNGGWTQYFYDSARRLAAVVDPANRSTKYDWCSCGALHGFEDANGNKTSFKQDIQMRVTEKEYADGSKIIYSYEEGSSRLHKITDAKSQVKNYAYHLDDNVKTLIYTGTGGGELSPPTAGVTLTFDLVFDRITTMVDGTGTTSYSYHTIGTAGALNLSSVDGPNSNDTIEYEYDELGRRIETQINGSANVSTRSYDAMGRVEEWTNELGTFTPAYVSSTANRLANVEFPNGQMINYDWEDVEGDFRVKEIENLANGGGTLSKFNYVTDAMSNIVQWRQQEGSESAQRFDFSYNPVGELLNGLLKEDSSGAVLKQYFYDYDRVGNRTSEQIDGVVRSSSYNNLNQLTESNAEGKLHVAGQLDESASVTVDGLPANMTSGTNFKAEIDATTGTNTVVIAATDASNNTRTNTYQIIVPGGASTTVIYDLNGNMLSDGGKTYTWDAENRLIRITYADSSSTEFTYDGLSRRVKIVEKDSGGAEASVKNHLWDGMAIAEERGGSNEVVKKFYGEGMVWNGEEYFYTRDHLGSIRELISGGSSVQSAYNYDPYGRQDDSLPSGMKLWLKADAGVTKDGSNKVSAWADQSGGGANASQATSGAQPTWVDNALNGKPVLRFDGSDDYLQGTNNGYNPSAGDYTIFVVHKRTSSAYWTGAFTYNAASGVYGAPIAGWRENTEQFGVNFVGSSDAGVYVNHSGAPNDYYLTTVQRKGGSNGNGGGLKVRSVSEGLLLESSGTQSWSSGASANYSVGRHWWNNGGHQLNGDVAEVIVYSRNLSPTERTRVEAYLGKKYDRNVVQSDFRYTGHYYHEKSGLTLAPFRAYSAELGRWISRDPIGEQGGINLYNYCINNPLKYNDPDGRILEWAPILGTIEQLARAFLRGVPGMHVSDYKAAAGDGSEPMCSFYINRAAAQFSGNNAMPNVIRWALDSAITIAIFALAPPAGALATIATVADALLSTGLMLYVNDEIQGAAAEAIKEYCCQE